MMSRMLFAGFAALAAYGSAAAADLPSRKAAPAPAPLVAAYDPTGFSVGPTLSTVGAGLELGYRATPYFGLRGALTALPLNIAFTTGGVSYSGKASFLSGSLLGDYYPFGGAFHLTGGAHFNRDSLTMTAATGPITISGFTFTAAQVGTLTSKVSYNPVAPYLGVGAETPVMMNGHVVISLDLGAMYQGPAKVLVAASAGGLAANYIAVEEAMVKHYADRLSSYPVVSIGAKYRF